MTDIIFLFDNNQRKRYGVPLKRKTDRRKRIYTRNPADEAVQAFVDGCNGTFDKLIERHRNGKEKA